MQMKIKGKVWLFEDNVDTDMIIPARFLNMSDEHVLGKKCFADKRPGFSSRVARGDVLVAGSNFGCGSSREHAPLAIKAAGIGAIVAKSFARIFYRNAFNVGLPLLESDRAADLLEEADEISVDLESGEILKIRDALKLKTRPIPDFMRQIIEMGGLTGYTINKELTAS